MPEQSFNVKDLPVETVVVYPDRAEVKRKVKCSVQPGSNEIVVSDIATKADPDSIRYISQQQKVW